jgi:hypothetical protein
LQTCSPGALLIQKLFVWVIHCCSILRVLS